MHRDATATSKICCSCNDDKPISEFASKNATTGQRQSRCRACQKIASRTHYEAHRETVIARSAQNTATRAKALRKIVRESLRGKACACGAKRKLTYVADPGYVGMRVSEACHVGAAEGTLQEAMANSSIKCPSCMWSGFVAPMVEGRDHANAARRAGVAYERRTRPKAFYDRRHSRVAVDRRASAFRGPCIN